MKIQRLLFAAPGVLLGVVLGMGIHTQISEGAGLTYQRFVAMTNLLQQKQDAVSSLQQEITRLRASPTPAVARQIVREQEQALLAARRAAGRTAVTGQGISLWLDDSLLPTAIGVSPDEYILHDQDLLTVVNDLNSAGATAISINGIRLVATSDIHCAGAVISVGGVRTSIPVTILALGNPSNLAASISGPTGELKLLSLYGIRIRLTPERHLTVPSY